MNSNEKKRWRISLVFLALIVSSLLYFPHAATVYFQQAQGVDIDYTPSLLNERWSRYDDIVKFYPAWQIGLNGSLSGKIGVPHDEAVIFPNVLQELLPSAIMALPVAVTRSPDAAFYASPILTALAAILLAILVRWLLPPDRKSIIFPVAVALTVITSYNAFSLDRLPFVEVPITEFAQGILNRSLKNPYEYNSFYRPHTLGGSYFIFVAFLLWFVRLVDANGQGWKFVLAGAALTGAQFYTYFFYSVGAAFCLLTALAFFLLFGRGEYRKRGAMTVFLSGLGGLVLAVPSLWNTVSLVTAPENHEWLLRLRGAPSTRWFWANWQVLILAVASLWLMPSRAGKLILASLALAVLVFENLENLVGFNIQQGHLYMRTALPTLVCGLFILGYRAWLPLAGNVFVRRASATIALASCLALAGMACVHSYEYAKQNYRTQGVEPGERGILEYLAKQPPAQVGTLFPVMNEAVILHARQSAYLPAVHHLPSTQTNAMILERLALMLWLANADDEAIGALAVPGVGSEKAYSRYGYYYFQRLYKPRGIVPLEKFREEMARGVAHYRQLFGSPEDVCRVAAGNGVPLPDFLVLGGWGGAMARLSASDHALLTPVLRSGAYTIYKVGCNGARNAP